MPANLENESVTVQHPLTKYALKADWTVVRTDRPPRSGTASIRFLSRRENASAT